MVRNGWDESGKTGREQEEGRMRAGGDDVSVMGALTFADLGEVWLPADGSPGGVIGAGTREPRPRPWPYGQIQMARWKAVLRRPSPAPGSRLSAKISFRR